MIIEVNNKQWTKIQLNAGFACLAPQTPCGFFLSRTDLGTDVNNLDTRLDVLSFSTSLAGNLKSSLDVWLLSTIDNALISYETDVVSGAKVIFISQGGGGGGQTGSYTFNSPLSEVNGNVNLNFDTNGLKLQNDRLTLDLTTYQDFLDVQNEIANINTDINALEMQDNLFTQDINDLKTRVGSVTLQTTSQDLSGAVNELKAGITSNTLTFQGALQKVGNDVSIGLENDITLNATGDKLTLNLLSNSDFRNALLGIDEAKRIATFTDVGRVKPLQNHLTINAMNGELGLDLSQTGILSSTFVTNTNFQNLQTSVSANTQSITRIDNEIAGIDNTINDLETLKANSADVYLKTDTYNQTEVNNLLANKTNTSDFNSLQQDVTNLDSSVVKLSGDQTINGIKTFSDNVVVSNGVKYTSTNMILSPSTNTNNDIVLADNTIGSNCYSNINFMNKGTIKNMPTPVNDTDGANKIYVDNKITSSALNFQGALIKSGNTVSIGLENDIVLNATGDKLTLNLNSNTDFRNLLLKANENSRIASFTEIGRVKPLQNHLTINAMNGELGLDLTSTGVLSANFATKASLQGLQTSISSNTQNIARIDSEIADIDNAVNVLEANKANSNEVYLKTETYSQSEVNNLLLGKADTTSLTPLENQIQTNTGNITQNQTDIQNTKQSVQTLDGEVVKLTNIQQNIDGIKTFLKELTANNIKATDNGIGYGAVDIRSQDGYFSITEDGGASLINLLATLGFVDSTTTFRIRNLAGGLITFNTLLQYETNQVPTNDNDLIPLSTLNQVKQELLNIINSLQSGAIHFVGVINNTSVEVTTNPTLLTDFVQAQESRTPKNGDFVKTSDSYGFIFNGTNWINFGQVSISIATTTSAGVVMLGSDEGELQDEGNGKVKVIGWDNVITRLNDLDTRITNNLQAIQTNTQNIQTNTQSIQTNTNAISTLDSSVVKLAEVQTLTGEKTFSAYTTITNKVDLNNPSTINDFVMRFIGDQWNASQSTDLIRFHRGGARSGYKVYLSGGTFSYSELWGLTLISNMKDPTADSHGVNVRYVKNNFLPKTTTDAVTTLQVTNSAQKYFNLDYVVTGTGFRNYSGIKLRAKQGTGNFVDMWKLEYHNLDTEGIFMNCVGNKLSFDNPTKIINVSCEDSDADNNAVSKGYLNTKLTNLNQNFVDLTSQQIIGGEKDFTSELRALTLVANDNGSDYGAVDIRNSNGYFSITDDTQGTSAVTLKGAIGFVDDATTFRIRNMNGGLVTFNSLAQYEGTYTPTDDKDLVHLGFVNQIKQELLNKINSIPAGLHFVGEIQHTSQEVTLDSDLLNQFVQTTESRQPRDGDFVRTSDSYGFIYSTTTWRNFGKISISIATTSNAGIVMLGSNPGELQDIGSGKVKVIGWDTFQNALTNLDNRTNTNTTNIALKANSADVYPKTETYTKNEVDNLLVNKADSSALVNLASQVQTNTQNLQSKADQTNLDITNQNITSIEVDIGSISSLPYSQTNIVDAINELKNNSVLLTGDQVVNGDKNFYGITTFSTKVKMGHGASTVYLIPEDDSRKTIVLGDSTIGNSNRFDIDCENNSRIKNLPEPTTTTEPLTYGAIFKDSSFVPSASNVPVGGGVFVVQ